MTESTLEQVARGEVEVEPPAVFVIGEVVRLRTAPGRGLKTRAQDTILPHMVVRACLFGGFFALFVLAGLDRFETFFAALGAFGGALDQFGTDQFQHGLLGAVALAPA